MVVLGMAPASAVPTTNVVLIIADDAGYNEIGYTGDNPFQTPRIDALAASGIRFTNGYVTCPLCSPSRAGLVTGLYQQRFGYEHNISNALDGSDALTASQVTLIQRFRD
ncbi:MAG: sulfatase-like hydrolase/transferase, partial [Planctomycetota bacterium]